MSTALHLLILEDEPLDAELEVATLEEAGYACQWKRVETCAEFLACLDTPDYDIVLADYNLPAFDGLTALHLFLERGLDLPFIFVSGAMGEETAIESLKAGATDYVLKERLSRLGPVVERALHEREDHRQRKQAEETLQKSQQLLHAIVDNSPVAIQVKDPEGRYLLINSQIETIFDLQRQEAIGKTPHDLFPPEIADKFLADDQAALQARTTVQTEETVPFPDGLHTFVVLKFPLVDEAGEPYAVAGISTDITERKRAEEALRESEERHRALFETTTLGVLYRDSEGKVIAANPAAEQILGLTFEQMGNDTHTDPKWKIVREDGTAFPLDELPAAVALKTGGKVQDVIVGTFPAARDEICWLNVNVTPLFRRGESKPYRIYTVFEDITERKQTEEERERLLAEIREQAQRVQQIIDTVPEGVILLDTDSRIILANPLGREDLSILADTLVGGTLTRLGDRPLTAVLTSPPHGLWHEVTAGERVFQAIARPIEIGPTPRGWVLVIHEVTQQREIERRVQQQERLAAVGQLAAGIAHDFNNIMAVISLYAGMSLRTADLPAKVGERLETIDQQARRASDLIQQILDFSRHAVLERRPMELKALLKEQVKLLERTLPENIQVDLDVGGDEYIVNADPTRVQQAIMNLATNARDAMPEGGRLCIDLAKVQVAKRKSAPLPDMEPGEWVRVTVADTGTGIPPDVLPHIYDPFFTTKPVGMGTGLGLSQVYGIVKQHEGQIDVATQEGEGTTFTIYLPAIAPQRPKPPHYEPETLVQGQGQPILVVEDDNATRAALVDSLELLDYRVVETTNGQEALSILEQHAGRSPAGPEQEIALVLSDAVMPGMGGRALFHALQERNLATKVVLLTGHPLDEGELEGLRSQGLGGWLLKPLSIEQLSQVVAEALGEE